MLYVYYKHAIAHRFNFFSYFSSTTQTQIQIIIYGQCECGHFQCLNVNVWMHVNACECETSMLCKIEEPYDLTLHRKTQLEHPDWTEHFVYAFSELMLNFLSIAVCNRPTPFGSNLLKNFSQLRVSIELHTCDHNDDNSASIMLDFLHSYNWIIEFFRNFFWKFSMNSQRSNLRSNEREYIQFLCDTRAEILKKSLTTIKNKTNTHKHTNSPFLWKLAPLNQSISNLFLCFFLFFVCVFFLNSVPIYLFFN